MGGTTATMTKLVQCCSGGNSDKGNVDNGTKHDNNIH